MFILLGYKKTSQHENCQMKIGYMNEKHHVSQKKNKEQKEEITLRAESSVN